jgi:hypothetical protein
MNGLLRGSIGAVALLALFTTAGCKGKDRLVAVDPPPFVVEGVYSITGDFEVTIRWRANQESDIAYYAVYRNGAPTGTYHLIGTSTGTSYVDQSVTNGNTYYYAVAAVDNAGQESPSLSYENVFDTPRPEGLNESMTNSLSNDAVSGWDFSAYTNRSSLDARTDVFYEYQNGHYLILVPADTKVQDAGYVALRDVDYAPPAGWSADGVVEAIVGHSYIFYTRDAHYAKIEVKTRGTGGITFDWAYQIDPDNPELARRMP